jgi:hypothetical protein
VYSSHNSLYPSICSFPCRHLPKESAGAQGHNVSSLGPKNVRRPGVKSGSTLAVKIVPLVNPSDAPKLRWLVREQLIDNNAVETERG